MGTRTVRLDDEAEQLLSEVRRRTGTTISGALKRGLQVAAERLRALTVFTLDRRDFTVYREVIGRTQRAFRMIDPS